MKFGWGQPWNHGVTFFPAPVICHAPVIVTPPPHVHGFAVIFEQEWVAPVFQTITVGYDSCGAAILKQVMVQPGFHRTAKYQVCGCGEKVFLGYV